MYYITATEGRFLEELIEDLEEEIKQAEVVDDNDLYIRIEQATTMLRMLEIAELKE